MNLPLRGPGAEPFELVAYDGKQFELLCDRAHAPGQPLPLDLLVGVGHRLDLKSTGSRKLPDGRFAVRARATTLTRGAREALDQAFGLQP